MHDSFFHYLFHVSVHVYLAIAIRIKIVDRNETARAAQERVKTYRRRKDRPGVPLQQRCGQARSLNAQEDLKMMCTSKGKIDGHNFLGKAAASAEYLNEIVFVPTHADSLSLR